MNSSIHLAVETAPASLRRQEHVATKEMRRIPALDGLRGIAGLMVLCYHFGPHIVREARTPFQFLHKIPPFWFEGVDLFFVLSGFLISGILLSERTSPRYYKTFYARRAFRIFPLYYLVFISYCGATMYLQQRTTDLGRLFENPLPLWPYGLYLQNFVMASKNTFGPTWMAGSWSLAVEEQFYLTLPAIVRRVSEQMLWRLTITAIIAGPLLRALIQKFKWLPGEANYLLLPTSVDSLAVGVLAMLVLRRFRGYLQEHSMKLGWYIAIAFVLWSIYPWLPNPQAIRMAFLSRTLNSIIFGGILLLIVLSPRHSISRFLSLPGMRQLGNMSYSTYLFHPILLCVVFLMMRGKDPTLSSLNDVAPVVAAGLLTAALSFASWRLLERRLIGIGHRFEY
jgi:peptidoglycan/LPS O-acetylase OafA/YrhL